MWNFENNNLVVGISKNFHLIKEKRKFHAFECSFLLKEENISYLSRNWNSSKEKYLHFILYALFWSEVFTPLVSPPNTLMSKNNY